MRSRLDAEDSSPDETDEKDLDEVGLVAQLSSRAGREKRRRGQAEGGAASGRVVWEALSLRKGRRSYPSSDSSADDSDTDSHSSDSDEDAEPPRRRQGARDTGSPFGNWEVWLGITMGLIGVVGLAYYLYTHPASSASTPSASASAAVAPTTTPAAADVTTAPAATVPATDTAAATAETAGSTASSATDDSSASASSPASRTESSKDTSSSGGVKGAASTSASGSTATGKASGQTYTGKATFYTQNGVTGACGKVNPDSALICALRTETYAGGKNCGKMIRITRTSGKGGSVDVQVADMCPSCEGPGYVDLSTGAYNKLGTVDEGWFDISWQFID